VRVICKEARRLQALGFRTQIEFSKDLLLGLTTMMNLQCACLRLAVVSQPPAPAATPVADKLPIAANDNFPQWPQLPFPAGWHATN
jgi:hypothetical protein